MVVLTSRGFYASAPDVERPDVRTVAVVGAGLSGLVVAYELKRRGLNVRLFEATGRAGGVIGTTRESGFLAEHGPNSCTFTAALEALTNALGIHAQVAHTDAGMKKRFLVRNGAVLPAPQSPGDLVRTPLFSARAKLRALLEPVLRTRNVIDDVPVSQFVENHLGREVLMYAVDPMVSGIFAGDPSRLSMMHAFPRIFSLAQENGSIIRGMIKRQLGEKHSKDKNAEGRSKAQRRSISFKHGMQTLTDSLADAIGDSLQLETPVEMVNLDDQQRWVFEAGNSDSSKAYSVDAFVMATSAFAFAEMELPAELRKPALPIERIEYPPVSTLTLGFRRSDITHPLDGFGVLVPSVEKRNLLGALFNSSLFAGRAPDGHVTITCFVGGARNSQIASYTTERLLELVLPDLRALLGVSASPVWVHHSFWPHAIPQYNIGYQAVKDSIIKTESTNPGFFIAGSFRDGISIGDCITVAQHTSERVSAYLAQKG